MSAKNTESPAKHRMMQSVPSFSAFSASSVKKRIMVARWHVFRPKNPNLGKFWSVLQWTMLVYFMVVSSILWPFVIFCGYL
jgi:hypothetical protein